MSCSFKAVQSRIAQDFLAIVGRLASQYTNWGKYSRHENSADWGTSLGASMRHPYLPNSFSMSFWEGRTSKSTSSKQWNQLHATALRTCNSVDMYARCIDAALDAQCIGDLIFEKGPHPTKIENWISHTQLLHMTKVSIRVCSIVVFFFVSTSDFWVCFITVYRTLAVGLVDRNERLPVLLVHMSLASIAVITN